METGEKSYIVKLKNLFEVGDVVSVKNYILNFSENDDDYDIFIQKLQEFAKNDEFDIIEEIISDETLLSFTKKGQDYDFDDEQEFENYLIGDEEEHDELTDNVPDYEEDEDVKNIEKDLGEESKTFITELLGSFGIEDIS